MRSFKFLLIGAMLASTTAAVARSDNSQARGETELAKMLDGRIAGQPVDCIQQHDIESAQVIDGTAIVYRNGSRLYVNRPESGAHSLDSDDILVTDTHSSQLCSIDVVRLIDRTSGFPHGFVGLGKFVPYTKPKQS